MNEPAKFLDPQHQAKLAALVRFEANPNRHCGIAWQQVQARLETQPERLWSLYQVEPLTKAQYRTLQTLGEFDAKTSSWVQIPPEIRELGGALFGDRRYKIPYLCIITARTRITRRAAFALCLRFESA